MKNIDEILKQQDILCLEELIADGLAINDICLSEIIVSVYEDAQTINLEFIQKLLDLGVDINKVDKNGATAVHTASLYGDLDLVKILVKYGADVNFISLNDETTLTVSLEYYFETKNLDLLEFLIKNGADVNLVDNSGLSILMVLFTMLDEKLLSQLANEHLCLTTTKNDILRLINFLIQKGATVNVDEKINNISKLLFFTIQGNIEAVNILLENGANINDSELPGIFMMQKNNFKLFTNSLDNSQYFMFENFEKNKFDILTLFIKYGMNFDWVLQHTLALYLDSHQTQTEFINNADICFKDKMKNILIGNNIMLSNKDSLKMTKFLFENGVKIILDKDTLHLVCQIIKRQSIELLELILEHIDDISILQDFWPENPFLFQAFETKNYKMIEMLLAKGVDVNQPFLLETPLLFAIKHKDLKLVQLLIKPKLCNSQAII